MTRNLSEVLISIIPQVIRIPFRVVVVYRLKRGMRIRISYLKFGERQWEVLVIVVVRRLQLYCDQWEIQYCSLSSWWCHWLGRRLHFCIWAGTSQVPERDLYTSICTNVTFYKRIVGSFILILVDLFARRRYCHYIARRTIHLVTSLVLRPILRSRLSCGKFFTRDSKRLCTFELHKE